MALIPNGRKIFQSPSRYQGLYSNQTGNHIKGGLRNRFVGGLDARFGGYNNGVLAPSSFILPTKPGSMATYASSFETMEVTSAALTPASNLNVNITGAITLTNAQLGQIVSAVMSTSGSISVTNAALAAVAGISADMDGSITITSAQLGAIFSVLVSGGATISPDLDLTALGFISCDIGGPTPLSPESLAQAVWNAILADYTATGSTGEALGNASSAGNPWDSLLSANNDPGTFGERVQKLLTQNKFLGLK
jgi:hypothetical protein